MLATVMTVDAADVGLVLRVEVVVEEESEARWGSVAMECGGAEGVGRKGALRL